ncbi:hypothetical protein [Polaromonas sp.]|uniref:hypothetical protein n=1 Tax=Polaromonas sp. TaxID=1869339 RepID=UPI0013BB0520|nr:hypothetical protein [Polaromonas sp.]NDP62790.1 hypothetical protein [Polaromonas sp.]
MSGRTGDPIRTWAQRRALPCLAVSWNKNPDLFLHHDRWNELALAGRVQQKTCSPTIRAWKSITRYLWQKRGTSRSACTISVHSNKPDRFTEVPPKKTHPQLHALPSGQVAGKNLPFTWEISTRQGHPNAWQGFALMEVESLLSRLAQQLLCKNYT